MNDIAATRPAGLGAAEDSLPVAAATVASAVRTAAAAVAAAAAAVSAAAFSSEQFLP